MSDESTYSELLEKAWRFAHVLTGCPDGATRAFDETLEEFRRHPHADDEDRLARLFLTLLRRRCLKFPARCELSGSAALLHRESEPGRSALALVCLNLLPGNEIQRVLNLDQRQLAAGLESARASMGASAK